MVLDSERLLRIAAYDGLTENVERTGVGQYKSIGIEKLSVGGLYGQLPGYLGKAGGTLDRRRIALQPRRDSSGRLEIFHELTVGDDAFRNDIDISVFWYKAVVRLFDIRFRHEQKPDSQSYCQAEQLCKVPPQVVDKEFQHRSYILLFRLSTIRPSNRLMI